ncbi:MAG: helix-turn-helix domain-containing protein [Deltaproteobacteria bacterium]|nr:helix-turn-helix domain-containing protein [Deltaproteobacteria bacterium]
MESPGEHLKREREQRGISLRKVFEATRVPLKFLEAIESDDFESLPHPTFVKGYIKSYCKLLGIDENDSALRYDLFLREKNSKAYDLAPLPETKDRKKSLLLASSRSRMIAAAVASVVIIVIVMAYQRRRGGAAHLARPEATTGVKTGAEPAKPESAPPTAEQKPSLAPAQAARAAKEARPSVKSERPAPRAAAETRKETAKEAAHGAPAVPAGHTLFVRAKENVWMKVRVDGAEPIDVLLRSGEAVTWKASDNFSVLIGNAGGVEASFDGTPLGAIGKSGEVVNFRLPAASGVTR